MFRIGEFSKLCKTTIKTLRYYDEVGLLKPEYIDDETKYRFYAAKQILELHHIQALRQIGLSISEIKLIQDGHGMERILQNRKREIEKELDEGREQITRIEFMLSGREEENMRQYQGIVKEIPECIVYSKKLTIPGYSSYFQIIPGIGAAVQEANPDLKCATPEYCFCEYLDGEYREKDINIEFCEAVNRFGKEIEGVTFKKMEPVVVASVIHKGPYEELPKAYAYLFKWVEENGFIVAGHPRESYIDGIWNAEDPKQWLTELQIPVIKDKKRCLS